MKGTYDVLSTRRNATLDVILVFSHMCWAAPMLCAGAGVGVGMLRGSGTPFNENEKSLGFLVAKFHSFKDSKTFNVWKILLP